MSEPIHHRPLRLTPQIVKVKKPGPSRAFLWDKNKSLIIWPVPAVFITPLLRLVVTPALLIFDDAPTHTKSRAGLVRQSGGDILAVVAISHVVALDDFVAGINLAAALDLFGARLIRVGDTITDHHTGNAAHCGCGLVTRAAADLAAQQRAGQTADYRAGCGTVAVRIGHAVTDHCTGYRTGAGRGRIAATAANLAAQQAAGHTADYRAADGAFFRRDLHGFRPAFALRFRDALVDRGAGNHARGVGKIRRECAAIQGNQAQSQQTFLHFFTPLETPVNHGTAL